MFAIIAAASTLKNEETFLHLTAAKFSTTKRSIGLVANYRLGADTYGLNLRVKDLVVVLIGQNEGSRIALALSDQKHAASIK